MKTGELFAGTKSFSKCAWARGHKTWTTDIKGNHNHIGDLISEETILKIPCVDLLWCSPPCTTFSIASCGHHWTKNKTPKTEACLKGLELLNYTIKVIKAQLIYNPDMVWFIENPRGIMRKVIDDIFKENRVTDYKRHTITYCQYGEARMKPTDIWTNSKKWIPRTICKNGDPCHVAAPRGSRTGTQGMKNNKLRSMIPQALFEEIFDIIESK